MAKDKISLKASFKGLRERIKEELGEDSGKAASGAKKATGAEGAGSAAAKTAGGLKRIAVQRVPTGIPGFDSLVAGGFERDGISLIGGDSGTGKSIFCLQYLYNGIVEYGEPGIYLSFAESKEAVYTHAKLFGWDFEKLEKEGKFAFLKYEPHAVVKILDEGGGTIREAIEALGAKRLVIDSITAYSMFFKSSYEASESLLQLFDLLRGWKCTTLLVSEEIVGLEMRKGDRSEFLADGIIYLYHLRKESARVRAVEVLKMRDTRIVEKLCPIEITDDGIAVYADADVFETTEKP
ncbi:Circadian clock protein kinase KaiC [uncultured archaeon]|nr:Circadian clock protein kinase KaiC [uncultured archaeon]